MRFYASHTAFFFMKTNFILYTSQKLPTRNKKIEINILLDK